MTADDNLGPLPELAWLPADKLDIDPAYQRTLDSKGSQKLIEKIASEFSWARFQTILTTPGKPGRWVVIDGQHRAEAARRCGIALVPAVVVAEIDRRDQAMVFVGANRDRRQVTAQELFHARLVAGDADALTVQRACDLAGIRITRSIIDANRIPVATTPAVAALLYCLKYHGEANMVAAVRAIARACATDRGGLRGEYFLGASRWLYQGGAHAELDGRIERIGGAAGLRRATSGSTGGGLQTKASLVAAALSRAGIGPRLAAGVDRARLMAGR